MADSATPTIRTFQVFPDIPEPLAPLLELARNLWWVWNPDAVELFRRLDRKLWEDVYHNPVKLLGAIVDRRSWPPRRKDDGYMAHLHRVHETFKEHLCAAGLVQREPRRQDDDEGGLLLGRVRAARIAADLFRRPGHSGRRSSEKRQRIGRAAGGVGLLYRNGYFQQYLSADGWQQEAYPELDFYNLPIEPMTFTDGSPVHVRVDMPENAVFCKVWRANVGRIPLYLLDTNLQENAPADRDITSQALRRAAPSCASSRKWSWGSAAFGARRRWASSRPSST